MTQTRRRTLQMLPTFLLAVGGAGCSALPGTARGVTDVVVENQTDTTATVSIVVTRTDGTATVDETLTVVPGEDEEINNEVVMETDTTVDVRVEGGPSGTYDWQDAVESLHVTLFDDEIAFEERSS